MVWRSYCQFLLQQLLRMERQSATAKDTQSVSKPTMHTLILFHYEIHLRNDGVRKLEFVSLLNY